MESIWREQQFEMDEDMPFLEDSAAVPASVVDISSDDDNDVPMQAAGPSFTHPDTNDWVMQRSQGNMQTVPITIPTYRMDQFLE